LPIKHIPTKKHLMSPQKTGAGNAGTPLLFFSRGRHKNSGETSFCGWDGKAHGQLLFTTKIIYIK
jgi:hypothetical protein